MATVPSFRPDIPCPIHGTKFVRKRRGPAKKGFTYTCGIQTCLWRIYMC